jgi:hypothetical protein
LAPQLAGASAMPLALQVSEEAWLERVGRGEQGEAMKGGTALFRSAMRTHTITKRNNPGTPRSRNSVLIASIQGQSRSGMAARGDEIMNRSQKVRHSEEWMRRCPQEDIVICPTANQQGCATVPFQFAQAAEQRETMKLQRRALTETPGVMTIAGQSVLLPN